MRHFPEPHGPRHRRCPLAGFANNRRAYCGGAKYLLAAHMKATLRLTAANECHENAVLIHSFIRVPLGSTCALANRNVGSRGVEPDVGYRRVDWRSDWHLHRSEQSQCAAYDGRI